jgi:SAM-dependent methyltransferase
MAGRPMRHFMSSISLPAAGQSFAFRELDPDGEATLEVMSLAPRFNRWMFETIRPFLAGTILEIGSGIGNISAQLLDAGLDSVLSDVRPQYCHRLRREFGGHPHCQGVVPLDLVHPAFDRAYSRLLSRFDTLFALNVVEHIEDDAQALTNCRKLLRRGGRLVVLVPAYQALYNSIDRELCHFRRYTRGTLDGAFVAGGMEVERSFYFNTTGAIGWFISGLMRRKAPPRMLVQIYNLLVPLARLVDRLTLRQIGLSVVAVGRTPTAVSLPLAA